MRYAVALFMLLTVPAAARAQSDDEGAIQKTVEGFLARLGDHQFDTLDADFTPRAIIVVTRLRTAAGGTSEWTNSYQTAEEWLAGLKRNPNPTSFREPITKVKMTVDSDRLAYLRADFQVVRDGRTVSSGVDQFTLVREPAGWKIAVIAYTSIPAK